MTYATSLRCLTFKRLIGLTITLPAKTVSSFILNEPTFIIDWGLCGSSRKVRNGSREAVELQLYSTKVCWDGSVFCSVVNWTVSRKARIQWDRILFSLAGRGKKKTETDLRISKWPEMRGILLSFFCFFFFYIVIQNDFSLPYFALYV